MKCIQCGNEINDGMLCDQCKNKQYNNEIVNDNVTEVVSSNESNNKKISFLNIIITLTIIYGIIDVVFVLYVMMTDSNYGVAESIFSVLYVIGKTVALVYGIKYVYKINNTIAKLALVAFSLWVLVRILGMILGITIAINGGFGNFVVG